MKEETQSTFQKINRKVHVYAGLFSIIFVIFFGVSGFVLNHRWKIGDWFSTRVEATQDITVSIPATGTDLEKARNILKQLNLDGEIHRITSEPLKQSFSFDLQRPGQFAGVKLNSESGKGTVKTTDFNAWSIVHIMHTFSGHGDKNWKWANIWKFFSDLSAVALVVLSVSGFIMWLRMKSARRWGLVALEAGTVTFLLLVWFLSKFNF